VALPWSVEINVPDMPFEQWSAMSAPERNAWFSSGHPALRSISGAEKFAYVLGASPGSFVYQWTLYFIPTFLAALICGVLVNDHRAP
jgi:hypothetical protein